MIRSSRQKIFRQNLNGTQIHVSAKLKLQMFVTWIYFYPLGRRKHTKCKMSYWRSQLLKNQQGVFTADSLHIGVWRRKLQVKPRIIQCKSQKETSRSLQSNSFNIQRKNLEGERHRVTFFKAYSSPGPGFESRSLTSSFNKLLLGTYCVYHAWPSTGYHKLKKIQTGYPLRMSFQQGSQNRAECNKVCVCVCMHAGMSVQQQLKLSTRCVYKLRKLSRGSI